MSLIRQYLRQKMTKGLSGKYDVEVLKKEVKDEVTHILYDQTRRTPIVIPVINEIGLRGPSHGQGPRPQQGRPGEKAPAQPLSMNSMPRRKFPGKQVPDTEANDTRGRERTDARPY